MAQFALGTSNPPTNIEALPTPLSVPRAVHRDYAELVTAASGRVYGRGYPTCQWTFSRLTNEQRAQLKSFCPGASANVYIKTLANDELTTLTRRLWRGRRRKAENLPCETAWN